MCLFLCKSTCARFLAPVLTKTAASRAMWKKLRIMSSNFDCLVGSFFFFGSIFFSFLYFSDTIVYHGFAGGKNWRFTNILWFSALADATE